MSESNGSNPRSLNGRMGAMKSWANTDDPTARTAPARAEFDRRFERQVDPEGKLAPEVRARRAVYARKAYFLELSARSARARARRHKARDEDVLLRAELLSAADELKKEL